MTSAYITEASRRAKLPISVRFASDGVYEIQWLEYRRVWSHPDNAKEQYLDAVEDLS